MTTPHPTITAKEQSEKNHQVEDCGHRLRSPKNVSVPTTVHNCFLKTEKSMKNVPPSYNTVKNIKMPFIEKVGVPLNAMGPIAEKHKQEPITKLSLIRGYC